MEGSRRRHGSKRLGASAHSGKGFHMVKGWILSAAIVGFACGVMFVPGAAQAKTCGSGYHHDANGHCQPNHPLPPFRTCPPGLHAHSAPTGKGYRCKHYP